MRKWRRERGRQPRVWVLYKPGHLPCMSLSGCPNYLRYFRFKELSRHLFPKDLLYTLYLSCFLAGYNDVQCINLCGVPIKAWSASLRWCEDWLLRLGSAWKPGEGLLLLLCELWFTERWDWRNAAFSGWLVCGGNMFCQKQEEPGWVLVIVMEKDLINKDLISWLCNMIVRVTILFIVQSRTLLRWKRECY